MVATLFNSGLLIKPALAISQLSIDADKRWPTTTNTPASTWYASGWGWRKKWTHAGTAAGALAGYQVRLHIYLGPGTDVPGTAYLNGHVQNNFNDLRFYSNAGVALPYWIDTYGYTAEESCYVIVKLDSVPASPGTADFWMYYGNSSAAAGASAAATFEAFDDFESGALANWTERDPIACTWTAAAEAVKDGVYGCKGIMTAAGQGGILSRNALAIQNCRLDAWVRLPDADVLADVQGGFVLNWADNNNHYQVKLTDVGATERLTIKEVNAGTGTDRATPAYTIAAGTWYKLTAKAYLNAGSLHVLGDINDVNYADYTDATPPPALYGGQDAINRANAAAATITHLELGNPFKTAGIVDTINIYVASAITGLKAGIFYLNGGNYKCRSAVSLGNIGTALRSFTGLNLAVQPGDVVGIYFATGTLDMANAGGSGASYAGDACNVGDEQAFAANANIYSQNGLGTVGSPLVGIFCASTIAARVWCDTFRVSKYVEPEPTFGAWAAEEEVYSYLGITNLKELAAGMAKGDIVYFDGTRLVKLIPGTIGQELTAHDFGADPTFTYPP